LAIISFVLAIVGGLIVAQATQTPPPPTSTTVAPIKPVVVIVEHPWALPERSIGKLVLRGTGWRDDNSVTLRYPGLHSDIWSNGRLLYNNTQVAVADAQFAYESGWPSAKSGFTYTVTATGDQSGTVVTAKYFVP
jgi:hypothetical protein